MLKLSPSTLNLLKDCPRCFWLQFKKDIKRPEGIFPSLPSGMDGVLKVYFDSYRKKSALPPEIDGKVEGKLFEDMDLLKIWRSNWKGLQKEYKKYDFLLRGAIDDVLISKNGKYIPFDFKTRGYPLKEDTHKHYQQQLDLYGLLFKENGCPPADFGYLLFFHPKSYSRGKATFQTDLIKMKISTAGAKKVLQKAYETLKGRMPKADAECGYCAYADALR